MSWTNHRKKTNNSNFGCLIIRVDQNYEKKLPQQSLAYQNLTEKVEIPYSHQCIKYIGMMGGGNDPIIIGTLALNTKKKLLKKV